MISIRINSKSGNYRDIVQILAEKVIQRKSDPIATQALGETRIVPIYLNVSGAVSRDEAERLLSSLHEIRIGTNTYPLEPKALKFLNDLEAWNSAISFNQPELQSLFTLLDNVLMLPENPLEKHFVEHLHRAVVAGNEALAKLDKVSGTEVTRGDVFNKINLNYRSGHSENLDLSIRTYRNRNELGLSLEANNPSQYCALSRPFNLTLSADEVAFISSDEFTATPWSQLKVEPMFERIAKYFETLKSRAA